MGKSTVRSVLVAALLLFLVAVGSHFLESAQAYQVVVDFMTEVLPVSHQLIERNIQEVLEMRGTIQIVGLVGLLWSGMGIFLSLEHNINRAWPEAQERNFLMQRLVALVMVGVLAGLLSLAMVSSSPAEMAKLPSPIMPTTFRSGLAKWAPTTAGRE